jgi:SNF2 family DNA or RNA helicase
VAINFKLLREKIAQGKRTSSRIHESLLSEDDAVSRTKQDISKANQSKILLRLAEIPIETLREVTESPLRIETLRKYGFTSMASVYHASESQLEKINGITADAAGEIKEIASRIYDSIADSVDFSFDINSFNESDIEVLESVQEVEGIRRHLRGKREKLSELANDLQQLTRRAEPLQSRLRWLFTKGLDKASALEAAETISSLMADPVTTVLITATEAAIEARNQAKESAALDDFKTRSSDYYAILDEIAGRSRVLGANALNEELIERIESQELNSSLIKATLRRYQVFGSKFALAQGRIILGDEMGLGKTIQAISLIAHRHHLGARRTLVVCPASVLINWQREFMERSDHEPIKMHGAVTKGEFARWRESGGVGLTTFDTLKTLAISNEEFAALDLDTVVVDEAHYVKNVDTGRTRTISRWISGVPHVLFMTGTPLENRVGEFVNLAGLLDKTFANSLDRFALAAGAETFRRSVAPMYLRRNSSEVLTELPDLIEVPEFCDWEGVDRHFYRMAVASGNFMAMRRAAYRSATPEVMPSKLVRLIEITEEAFASGQKVVIFSFFRDVLNLISSTLGEKALGPITGSTPPAQRQQLVDSFRDREHSAALIGQIQAAGTGLNIQAASVVILCEPQIKPSLEAQAIARARRMGQIRNVQVHRLIIPSSVDTTMLEMLERKIKDFDDYARESALADSVASAKDHSDESMAKLIVMEERRRLGIESNETVKLDDND